MIELFGILWLRPWWLLLVPLGVLIGVLLTRRAGRLGAWEGAIDPTLLATLRGLGRVLPGQRARSWLLPAVIAALGVALAGPATERRAGNSYRNLDAVVLVIDLSPSVTESGRLFDALTAARLVAEAAGTRQIAAILYAGEAFVAAPLTTDARELAGTLALLDAETMPVAGTRPEAGLALARQTLEDARILASDVVLIGDGGALGGALGGAALAETAALVSAGARVSTIAVPGDSDGAAALGALARAGQGVAGTLDDPFPVVRQLETRLATRLAETGYAVLVLNDLGRYLLVLALLPAFLLLPRRGRR
ncbi:MAG: vWA domain-containing protein [Pseudomonadota bacterium]